MTLWDFILAALKRWPVVLVGALLTMGAGLLAVEQRGVYYARMEVLFLTPVSWYKNVIQESVDGTVMTAGAVAKRVIGADQEIKFGSPEATLAGTSRVSEGTWIRAEDLGTQWAPAYQHPIIIVDVVAQSRVRVRELQHEAVDTISAQLDRLQGDLDVAKSQAITVKVAPEKSGIAYISGSRTRALAMTGVIGVVSTSTVIWLLATNAGGEPARRTSRDAAGRRKGW